jgi:multiple sugar transport system permease protein
MSVDIRPEGAYPRAIGRAEGLDQARCRKRAHGEWRLAYAMLVPASLVLLAVIFYPLVSTIIGAFSGDAGFTLDNFKAVVNQEAFGSVVWQSLIWTFGVVGILTGVSMVLALALNEPFRGRGLARVVLLLPWATPVAIAMMVWRYIFNEQYGHLNAVLRLLHLADRPVVWLGSPILGFGAIMAVEVWTAVPLMTLILMSGLQTIPDDLYDAAALDGASGWKVFFHVTLPLLHPVLITGTLLFVIWTFNSFSTIWIMTKGGPINMTDTLVTYTYKVAFQYQLFNQAMALSVFILIILLVFSLLYSTLYFRAES